MVGLYITLPNVELTIFQIPINSKVSNCHKYERRLLLPFPSVMVPILQCWGEWISIFCALLSHMVGNE